MDYYKTINNLITCVYLVLFLILLAGCAGSKQTVKPFEDGYTTEI